MDKILDDLICRMKKQIIDNEMKIIETKEKKDDTLLFLYIGKINAFEYCIKELYRLMEYSEIKSNNK